MGISIRIACSIASLSAEYKNNIHEYIRNVYMSDNTIIARNNIDIITNCF